MSILNARRPPPASPMRPTWAWDFARYGRVPPGATYTGNSGNGTYVNSAGVITASTNNSPRFDYDPATLSPLGYLAEMASTNAVTYSSDRTHWTATNVTLSNDGTLGPDGVTQMVKVLSAGGAVNHYAGMSPGSFGAGNVIGHSVFVKQGNCRYVMLIDDSDAVWHLATFDFNTGAWVNSGTNVTTETPRQFANGVWRLGWKATMTNNVGAVQVGPSTTGNGTTADLSSASAGTEYVYATGLQADSAGVGVTSYIPTAGSTVTRAQDVLSLPLTSLPGWSATQGGVLVAAYRLHTLVPSAPGYDQAAIVLTDAGPSNYVRAQTNEGGGGRTKFQVVSGGASQLQVNIAATPAVFTRSKVAGGWGTPRIGGSVDGGAVVGTSGSYLLPATPTSMDFGRWFTQSLNGTLESIAYYRGARSDAFVQAVSR